MIAQLSEQALPGSLPCDGLKSWAIQQSHSIKAEALAVASQPAV